MHAGSTSIVPRLSHFVQSVLVGHEDVTEIKLGRLFLETISS